MVDTNPVIGMPPALKRYWIIGKGAAKIRWTVPGDFARCVRNIRKYFPKDPKGLCANLHHEAMGKWPGREHPHNLAFEDQQAQALLAAAPMGDIRWMAPLAPIGKPTGDGRQFASNALSFRRFPLPLSWIKAETGGHSGRMTVGRILGATIGPDESGQEYAWGFGDFFNPAVIPEVIQALELVRGGVAGISLDPGGYVQVGMGVDDPNGRVFLSYKAGGATLVSIPAFENQYVVLSGPDDVAEDDDDTDEAVMMADWDIDDAEPQDQPGVRLEGEDCGCGEFAVNGQGWRGLPLAPRKTGVDRDDAVRRIGLWANGDVRKLNQAFLWRHPQGDPHSVQSYRLPVGDIFDGKLTLIYHAIYAASALLEGAHGGLPNIPASEKDQLRRVISAIYKHMANQFNDPTIKASWDRPQKRDNGVTPVAKKAGDSGDFTEVDMPLTELAADILVGEEVIETIEEPQTVVAAGGPLVPPAHWFEPQGIQHDPGLTITAEGQVFGYLAPWKQCHMSVGRGRCMKAPRSKTGYQFFHLGSQQVEWMTDDPTNPGTVKVGRLTVGGGHADVSLGIMPAMEHYDNAGTAVAVVRAYEDDYGIQVAGAIVPTATAEQIATLRRSPLSGDWRAVNGNLELVAALAVNVPGFPVFAEDEQGHEMALISAGFDAGTELGDHTHVDEEFEVDADEVAQKVIDILNERDAQNRRAQALADARKFDTQIAQNRRAEILRNIVGVK